MSNPLVDAINRYGYDAVELPREGIEPLQLAFGSKGCYKVSGKLPDLVVGGGASGLPSIGEDQQVANISALLEKKASITAGLEFLGNFLHVMGAKFRSAYTGDNSIEVVFENVMYNSVDATDIGKYLGPSKPNKTNPFIRNLSKKNPAFVIYRRIKSNFFGIIARDKNSVKVDISAKAKELTGEVEGEFSKYRESGISYKGAKFLTIGVNVLPVWIGDDAEFKVGLLQGGRGDLLALPQTSAPDKPKPVLLSKGSFLKLEWNDRR